MLLCQVCFSRSFWFVLSVCFPYTATSRSGLEVTPGPINHSNRQQPKHISQMKHLFCSASEPLHSPPSISLLPHFFIRLLMVYKLHIMVPPLPCAEAFFYGLSAFVRENSYKWEAAAEAVKLWAELMKVKLLNCAHLLYCWTALWLPIETQLCKMMFLLVLVCMWLEGFHYFCGLNWCESVGSGHSGSSHSVKTCLFLWAEKDMQSLCFEELYSAFIIWCKISQSTGCSLSLIEELFITV